MDPLIVLGYKKSIELLKQNSMPFGFQAAPVNPQKPDYSFLFGRDGSICALCVVDHEDEQLQKTALKTLTSLRNLRSDLGQVPFRADPATGYRDFWFPGNLDSTLWWVLASLKMAQHQPKIKTEWQQDIEHSMRWLRYQDAAEVGLLIQGERADWADELPNHGAVLYSNALWYKVVSEYLATYGSSDLVSRDYQERIFQSFNAAFWPYEDQSHTLPNRALQRSIDWAKSDLVKQPFYISYLSRRGYGRRCDIFANTLAMMFGLADQDRQRQIEQYLWSIQASRPYPGRSLYPVIYPGESDWQDGMAARNQNLPYQYHNGGIWPFIGGFWVTFLATQSREARASAPELSASSSVDQELLKLAEANSLNNWEFNEYLHGQYGTAMGIAHQSWNAATYMLAYQALVHGHSLLQLPEHRKKSATKPLMPDATGGMTAKLPRRFLKSSN